MTGKDWLGKRVRVHSGPDWRMEHTPLAEGEVVYCIDGPSIGVREDDGNIKAWPVALPIDVVPVAPPHVELLKIAAELEAEAQDWSNDPAAMGAKADAAARIREALDGAR